MSTNTGHAQRAHALLSASGADRWINCTPSARMEEKMPDKGSGYADEGTLAHELCEAMVKTKLAGTTTQEFCDKWKDVQKKCDAKGWNADDMCTHAHTYADYVLEVFNQAKLTDKLAKLIIEEKVDLTEWIEDGFGTCDATIIANGTLHVIDFKYGQGVKVSPDDNAQLKMYGLGSLRANDLCYGIDSVELHVVQPRLNHIESWKISAKELSNWGDTIVKPKAKEAYEGKGTCKAGKWCKFCKVKPTCRAAKEAAFELIREGFDEPKLLSDTEIASVLERAEQAIDWFNSVQDYALLEVVEGRKKFEGWKVVEGKSNRKWTDEEKVAELLVLDFGQDKVLNTKLKGIGDIEKLVGKKEFTTLLGDYVIKPQGKPTLVPASDKRADWAKVNNNDFKD